MAKTIARKKCWHYSFKLLALYLSAHQGKLHQHFKKTLYKYVAYQLHITLTETHNDT